MDHQCFAFEQLYGWIHGLQQCNYCKAIFCSCTDNCIKCDNCAMDFCSTCGVINEAFSKLDFCDCYLCKDCLDRNNYYHHGNKCASFRNKVKMLLYLDNRFNVDMIDYISTFLWWCQRRKKINTLRGLTTCSYTKKMKGLRRRMGHLQSPKMRIYHLYCLTKSKVFCAWYYSPDNIGCKFQRMEKFLGIILNWFLAIR